MVPILGTDCLRSTVQRAFKACIGCREVTVRQVKCEVFSERYSNASNTLERCLKLSTIINSECRVACGSESAIQKCTTNTSTKIRREGFVDVKIVERVNHQRVRIDAAAKIVVRRVQRRKTVTNSRNVTRIIVTVGIFQFRAKPTSPLVAKRRIDTRAIIVIAILVKYGSAIAFCVQIVVHVRQTGTDCAIPAFIRLRCWSGS